MLKVEMELNIINKIKILEIIIGLAFGITIGTIIFILILSINECKDNMIILLLIAFIFGNLICITYRVFNRVIHKIYNYKHNK